MTQQRSEGAILITGASSGIGAAYAEKLALRAHKVILVARDEARLKTLAAQIQARSDVDAEVLCADLLWTPDLVRVEQRLRSDPEITMLVNNAGMAKAGVAHLSDPDGIDAVIGLNVRALTRLAVAALSAFISRGSGTIINIGSVVGLMPEMRVPVYGATKAYVHYLTQSLNLEASGTGVRLQAVLPGLTRTEFLDRAGVGTAHIDPEQLMDAGDLVDAALAGFDQGEVMTIPSLPDPADLTAVDAVRLRLMPNLSKRRPAPRYRVRNA